MKLQLRRDPVSLQLTWADPFTFVGVSPFHGVAFYRIRGDGHILKAPWCAALFSERNGYKIPLVRLFGFRIFPLRAEELVHQAVRGEECPTYF